MPLPLDAPERRRVHVWRCLQDRIAKDPAVVRVSGSPAIEWNSNAADVHESQRQRRTASLVRRLVCGACQRIGRPGPHANLVYALECQRAQETHGEHEGSGEDWFPAEKRQPLGDHDVLQSRYPTASMCQRLRWATVVARV